MRRIDVGLQAAPHGPGSETDLHQQDRGKEQRGPGEFKSVSVLNEHTPDQGGDRRRHGNSTQAMREMESDAETPLRRQKPAESEREVGDREPGVVVTHRRAEQDLAVDERRNGHRETPENGITQGLDTPVAVSPTRRRKDAEADDQGKEELRQSGMADRNRLGQQVDHCDAAEQPLSHDRTQRRPGHPAHPPARLSAPGPEHQADGQQTDGARDQPMAVLVENAADHLREREREHEVAVCVRPVGNGQSRVRAPVSGRTDGTAPGSPPPEPQSGRVWPTPNA